MFVTFPLFDVKYVHCCYLSKFLMLASSVLGVRVSCCLTQDVRVHKDGIEELQDKLFGIGVEEYSGRLIPPL